MSDFTTAATLRPLAFQVTLVPGTTQVQGGTAYYEIVLPSGRAIQFNYALDLGLVQGVVDAASAAIVAQLLYVEGLTALWPAHPVVVAETAKAIDAGTQP